MRLFYCLLLICLEVSASSASITIDAGAGLQWTFQKVGGLLGLGQITYLGSALESPVTKGFAFWRRISDQLVIPVSASQLQHETSSATLTGSAILPGGIQTSVTMFVVLHSQYPAASLQLSFTTAADLKGWQLCIKYMDDGIAGPWRVQGYPQAGNSTILNSIGLQYFGWPGFMVYRPDGSDVSYFSLDINEDYMDPTKWTGSTQFSFQASDVNGGHQVAPQYMFGGSGLHGGEIYEVTMQLLFGSGKGDTLAAVNDIVPALLALNSYAVKPMPVVRTSEDSMACFLSARRTSVMWRETPAGEAYQLQDIANFIYLGTTPESALFEYEIYRITNDTFWRNRAFKQMEFWLKGQNTNPTSRHYGAVHTTYNLPYGPFNSDDRGVNRGYKIDVNAHMARYALLLWKAVESAEGSAPTTWLQGARLQAHWIYRMAEAQAGRANPGSKGFPQLIYQDSEVPSPSVTSGRTMNALRVFEIVLGQSPVNFTMLRTEAEGWMIGNTEQHLSFTGQHPDLPYNCYEQDSVWELVEYWLDAHDANPASEYALRRALGDAHLGLLMLCPKQLPWVDNPTQMAADEQQYYHQYTVYTYHNRKWLALTRLASATKDQLWQELADRLFQLNMFTQLTSGQPEGLGGFHEAIADPWLARGGGYNFVGSAYLNELALDLMLQLLLTGVKPSPSFSGCTRSFVNIVV